MMAWNMWLNVTELGVDMNIAMVIILVVEIVTNGIGNMT
jgi:hypothetical protein